MAAQIYNAQKIQDEFWEDMGTVAYVSSIDRADCINNPEIFRLVIDIFKHLDDSGLKFSSLTKPSDFIRRHIVTDGGKNISLCNKHLLKRNTTNKAQVYYTRDAWIKCIMKGLFPKIESAYKDGIPTNTPDWAINFYPRTTLKKKTL